MWDSLNRHTTYKVGDGTKILFRKESWNGQEALMTTFPELFAICSNPEVTVTESWTHQGWNMYFRRNLNDWEIDRVADLLKTVDKFEGTSTTANAMCWKHSSAGRFSVMRIYKWEIKRQPGGKAGPWYKVWSCLIPTKVRCFTWLVVRKACLTHEAPTEKGNTTSIQMSTLQ